MQIFVIETGVNGNPVEPSLPDAIHSFGSASFCYNADKSLAVCIFKIDDERASDFSAFLSQNSITAVDEESIDGEVFTRYSSSLQFAKNPPNLDIPKV